MLAKTFRGPHNLYRRYQAFLESTTASIGLAWLVVAALRALPVYPPNWTLVIGGAIALVGIRWPLLAFLAAVGVLAYPVYTVNLYLAVLFLAAGLLGARWFAHFLGATVLTLSTPLLAQYHLHWLVPILGGLWWGTAGAAIGGLAAVWGKLLGGMAGLNPDWLILSGQVPSAQAMVVRFQGANSLDTLLLLIEPFASTPDVVLYNLLQVVGWIVAGGVVGSLAQRRWVRYRTPWSILVVTAGGGVIMLATHLGLPYWLYNALTPEAVAALQNRTAPLFSLLVVIVVGTTVFTVRESLDLPVAPRQSIWRRRRVRTPAVRPVRPPRRKKTVRVGTARNPDPVPVQARPVSSLISDLPEWEPPQDESGLIMLEID
ncbi:MAG: hypothetical protein D6784_18325 [Chloroflexi bacterium]|nr:MAG: hypothetical protein D6784_18325 [Chloroflexota bacterium]